MFVLKVMVNGERKGNFEMPAVYLRIVLPDGEFRQSVEKFKHFSHLRYNSMPPFRVAFCVSVHLQSKAK
jgi:hypothetical protein